MKPIFYIIIIVCGLTSCHRNEPIGLYILDTSPSIQFKNEVVYYNHLPFNGTIYQLGESNNDTLSMDAYKNGLLDGISRKWYSNKKLMELREYKKGEKEGIQIAYWDNGNKRIEFTALRGVCEGELREWSQGGKLFHLAHFVNGQEEGEQKMWYENGKIRANYVIKNGRRFGLLGTKNCKNVSDSIFVVQ